MKNLLNFCNKARLITDEELAEADRVAKNQLEFIHPLKMATSAEQHKLGEYNQKVLAKLRDLRDTILQGP